jgi:hypothetical protein
MRKLELTIYHFSGDEAPRAPDPLDCPRAPVTAPRAGRGTRSQVFV